MLLAIATALVRALIPVGFMPASVHGSVQLMFCDGGGHHHPDGAPADHDPAGHHGADQGTCPFALSGAAPLLPGSMSGTLVAATVEEPTALGETIAHLSQPDTLVVVDCLTLWLTNLLMPAPAADGQHVFSEQDNATLADAPIQSLLQAIERASGPVLLVGNEIGMGVIPMGAPVRAFVDTLGRLNQEVARVCSRVTLMAAGLPLTLKGAA